MPRLRPTTRAWRPTTLLDARFVADPDTRPELPSRLTLHIGTAAPIVHTRPLGDGAVRIALPTPLPLVAGDRALVFVDAALPPTQGSFPLANERHRSMLDELVDRKGRLLQWTRWWPRSAHPA